MTKAIKDAAIIWVNHAGDITVNGEDLLIDESLTNFVIISLFTDRAVDPIELTDGQANRGWFGDSFSDSTWGSRLWLLSREKSLQSVLDDAEDYAYEALEWMRKEALVSEIMVKATRESTGKNAVKDILRLDIKLTLPSDNKTYQRELKIMIEGGL